MLQAHLDILQGLCFLQWKLVQGSGNHSLHISKCSYWTALGQEALVTLFLTAKTKSRHLLNT